MEKGIFSVEKKRDEFIIVKREESEESGVVGYIPIITDIKEEDMANKVCNALNAAYHEGLSDAFGSF